MIFFPEEWWSSWASAFSVLWVFVKSIAKTTKIFSHRSSSYFSSHFHVWSFFSLTAKDCFFQFHGEMPAERSKNIYLSSSPPYNLRIVFPHFTWENDLILENFYMFHFKKTTSKREQFSCIRKDSQQSISSHCWTQFTAI